MARPRSEDARRRVLDATVDALLAAGVEGTTIEAIADRSGVAKSTIYRHFGNRETLLVEAVRSCITSTPTPDTGSLADDLADLFGRYDEAENRQINALIPLLLDERRRDPAMQAAVDVVLAERQRPLRTVLQLAQFRGEIDPSLDLDVALAMLVGPVTYRRMIQDEEITDEFIATVLPGAIAALRSTAPSRISP
jgi:AcrR family transcriptional regulator